MSLLPPVRTIKLVLNIAERKESEIKFQPFSSASHSIHQLKTTSGLIFSPYGSFDPILQPIPLSPENIVDFQALDRTRFALVQSESADLTTLQQNLQERGLIVIESIPDDTIIIRIPIQYNSAITLHELGSMEGKMGGQTSIGELAHEIWQESMAGGKQ